MISETVKAAIVALLAADQTATEAEREAVAKALRGEPTGPQIYSIKETMGIIGRSRQTVYNLLKKGRIVGVRGSGDQYTGITSESLDKYLHPKK